MTFDCENTDIEGETNCEETHSHRRCDDGELPNPDKSGMLAKLVDVIPRIPDDHYVDRAD